MHALLCTTIFKTGCSWEVHLFVHFPPAHGAIDYCIKNLSNGHKNQYSPPPHTYGRVCERWNKQRAYTLRYVGANARSKRRSGAMMRMVAADFSKHCQREEGDRNCVCMGSISRLRALHTLGRAYGAGHVRI